VRRLEQVLPSVVVAVVAPAFGVAADSAGQGIFDQAAL